MISIKKVKTFLFKLIGVKLHNIHDPNLSRKDANRVVAYIATNNIKDIVLSCTCCFSQKKRTISLLKIYSRYTNNGKFCHVIVEGYIGAQLFMDAIEASRAWVSVQGSNFNLATTLQIQAKQKSMPHKFSKTILVS